MIKALALIIVFAMVAMAQQKGGRDLPGKLKSGTVQISCAANGKACTSSNVSDIMTGIAAGKRMHKPFLADIRSVALGGATGSLTCTQNSGQPCTEDQIKAVQSVAADAKVSLTYNSSHSNTGK